MADFDSPDVAIKRGLNADRLLKDPALQAAFTGVREGLVSQLEGVGLKDREMQHEIVLSLQLLAGVQHKLRKFIENGRFEQDKLSRLDQARRFMRQA